MFNSGFYRSITTPGSSLPTYDFVAYGLPSLSQFTMPTLPSPQPFRAELAPAANKSLQAKWNGVQQRMGREEGILQQCREDATACAAGAKKFLAIVERAQSRSGWNRIAEVNRSINLSIRAVSDMDQYGTRDLWATPLMTFSSGAGDCEDYAIAKYAALRELGYSDEELRIVIVHDNAAAEDHAVAAVRYEGRWLVLDNKTLDVRDDEAAVALNPLFMIDNEGVRKIVSLAAEPKQSPWTDPAALFAPTEMSLGWPFTTPM
jgi:predicted transglutaminase-like cysteine proteinase